MKAKYIKREADLNGTGHTQAYYKMRPTSMSHDDFVAGRRSQKHYLLKR